MTTRPEQRRAGREGSLARRAVRQATTRAAVIGARWKSHREPITIWTLLQSARRRWRIGLVGALATLAACYAAATVPGVYYQQADMIFIAPALPGVSNPLHEGSGSLVSAAGLVAREMPETSGGPLAPYTRVTIVDMGLREGTWVRLPNDGGQWAPNFDRAILDVQVVGRDPASVRARMSAAVEKIRTTLRDGQLSRGAPAGQLIEVGMSPPSPPILYKRGSSGRAFVAALLLGLGLTFATVSAVDRLRLQRIRLEWSRSHTSSDQANLSTLPHTANRA